MDKKAFQERLQALVGEALEEALTENGALKEAVKAAVKQAVVRRVSQAAEQEAAMLIDEALGVKEAGFRTDQ
jgi:hypothetical protein